MVGRIRLFRYRPHHVFLISIIFIWSSSSPSQSSSWPSNTGGCPTNLLKIVQKNIFCKSRRGCRIQSVTPNSAKHNHQMTGNFGSKTLCLPHSDLSFTFCPIINLIKHTDAIFCPCEWNTFGLKGADFPYRGGRVSPNSADLFRQFSRQTEVAERLHEIRICCFTFCCIFRPTINKDAFSESESLIHQRQK